MRKIFSKIFVPPEVKDTLQELNTIMNQFNGVCRKIIEPEVAAEIKIADKTIHSIRVQGMKPDHIALLLITNVIGRHLQCGQYHVYRGILGTVGEDMVNLWDFVQAQLQERGYHTREEVDEDKKWLNEEISRVG